MGISSHRASRTSNGIIYMKAVISTNEWDSTIAKTRSEFKSSLLDFDKERIFAAQMLSKNDYLAMVAKDNPLSLISAMHNVAAIGITLNPTMQQAYLIPRKPAYDKPPAVCLDIGYRGLIGLGVDSGSIVCAKAELVYFKDEFIYRGALEKPIHKFNPFSTDRGALVGGYCVAPLKDGTVMVDAMSVADMDQIRNSSEAYKKGFGPWKDWPEQMQLKTIVKRAAKWWPKSDLRLANAIRILNEDNGEGLAELAHSTPALPYDVTSSYDKNDVSPSSQDSVVSTVPEPSLPPPTASEFVGPLLVSEKCRNFVGKLVKRSIEMNAFEASKELIQQRLTTAHELDYALSRLKQAQNM